MRRLLPLLLTALAGLVALGCSSDDVDDGAAGGPASTTEATTTTTTEPASALTSFDAEDPEALCADLAGLADIDPDADPTPGDVQRLEAIAATAPPGVAEPLRTVADFARALLADEDPDDPEAVVEAAVILISYGNEVCDIDVPLFNTLAGV